MSFPPHRYYTPRHVEALQDLPPSSSTATASPAPGAPSPEETQAESQPADTRDEGGGVSLLELRRFGPRGIDTTPLAEPATASPAPADWLGQHIGVRALAARLDAAATAYAAESLDVLAYADELRNVALDLESESAQLRARDVQGSPELDASERGLRG